MNDPHIRAFERRDRAAVRSIAFATGFMGDPVDWLWRDRESFADLTTYYYTEHEPESILVADVGGVVVGYLLGCADSGRARGAVARQILRHTLRGALFRRGVAPFLWRSALDIWRDRGAVDDVLGDARWPAHLHINLLPRGRGVGLGRLLLTEWIERLERGNVPGVHLGTFAENHNAIRFFQSCGFNFYGEPIRALGFRTQDGHRMHVQWMVRAVGGGTGEVNLDRREGPTTG